MKRRIFYFIISILFVTGVVVFFKPAVLSLTQKVLKQRFSLDAVSIENIEFKRFNEICLQDIKVEKKELFFLKAQKIQLRLNLFDPIKAKRFKISVQSAALDFKRPHQTFTSYLRKNLSQEPSNVMFSEIEFLDFDLNVQFKDLQVAGKFSADVDITQQTVNSLHINISSLKYRGWNIENVLLWATRSNNRGEFTAGKILYDKVAVTKMNSSVRFENKDLIFYDFSAKVFDGNIKGDAVFSLAVVPEYQARLQFSGLDISRFVEDFELKNKFMMTGKAIGNIQLQGQGVVIKVLGGEFMTDNVGGRLIINDVSFLDKMPYRSSVDGLVGSVQDYYYDTGFAKLLLQGQDLLADIHLDGKQGKRDFNIILHQ
jgi:hypothetical protein